MSHKAQTIWTFVVTSVALVMVTLDNLVVTTALPVIRRDLHASLQGLGGAIVTPLTLTLLSAAVPAERRGLALGAWGGIGGLAVALGPLVGGAIVEGISWHWIFWLNVPIGVVMVPLALLRLEETRGAAGRPDFPRAGV